MIGNQYASIGNQSAILVFAVIVHTNLNKYQCRPFDIFDWLSHDLLADWRKNSTPSRPQPSIIDWKRIPFFKSYCFCQTLTAYRRPMISMRYTSVGIILYQMLLITFVYVWVESYSQAMFVAERDSQHHRIMMDLFGIPNLFLRLKGMSPNHRIDTDLEII